MKRLTEVKKAQIIALAEEGYSSRQIADVVLGSKGRKSTVNDFLQGYRASQESYPSRSAAIHTRDKTNDRILTISDMHIPYHHPDLLEFLEHLNHKYQPTRIICMGDELDKHALSYHDSDPDLPSAGDELRKSLPTIAETQQDVP